MSDTAFGFWATCWDCEGYGWQYRWFLFKKTCPVCGGTGRVWKTDIRETIPSRPQESHSMSSYVKRPSQLLHQAAAEITHRGWQVRGPDDEAFDTGDYKKRCSMLEALVFVSYSSPKEQLMSDETKKNMELAVTALGRQLSTRDVDAWERMPGRTEEDVLTALRSTASNFYRYDDLQKQSK